MCGRVQWCALVLAMGLGVLTTGSGLCRKLA